MKLASNSVATVETEPTDTDIVQVESTDITFETDEPALEEVDLPMASLIG
ncbi:hypothetical protein BC777_1780 [Yoonia maricola]|uniref:Uncharacterized protein n=1 Tax=Yoonia maricola TaxID=420999 RepID=A0A2M8WPQ1_9RHOB|nr:hypothetical protein BC777_1780 [Yoonia maricola]